MKTRREREAELVALMLFDLPHLRQECWRVIYQDAKYLPIAALSGQELIRCILEHEFPGQVPPERGRTAVVRRRPQ